MNHLDCFSGIGSWALAAKWMGWNTLAFVEKEPFCQQVLKKNFTGVPIHDDIFTFSALPFRGRVDVLTGSTPCQPYSQAGQHKGSGDKRHLYPELLRVVIEGEPEWVVFENVYGLLSIELGNLFENYCSSLESQGYAVQSFCIPASSLNGKHRRNRLWIIAHSDSIRRERREQRVLQAPQAGHDSQGVSEVLLRPSRFGDNFPTPRILRSGDGLPNGVDRIKSLGNAIVPQMGYEIFRAIQTSSHKAGDIAPPPNGRVQNCE